MIFFSFWNGTRGGIRTPDTRFRRPVLYPAELHVRINQRTDESVLIFFSNSSFHKAKRNTYASAFSGITFSIAPHVAIPSPGMVTVTVSPTLARKKVTDA